MDTHDVHAHAWRYKHSHRFRHLDKLCNAIDVDGDFESRFKQQINFVEHGIALLNRIQDYLNLKRDIRTCIKDISAIVKEMNSENTPLTLLSGKFSEYCNKINDISENNLMDGLVKDMQSFLQELKTRIGSIDKTTAEKTTKRSQRSLSYVSTSAFSLEKFRQNEVETNVLYHHCRDLMDEFLLDTLSFEQDWLRISNASLDNLLRGVPDMFERYQRQDPSSGLTFKSLSESRLGQKSFERYLISSESNELFLFCQSSADLASFMSQESVLRNACTIYQNFISEPLRCRIHFPPKLLEVLDQKFHPLRNCTDSEFTGIQSTVDFTVFDTAYKIARNHLEKYRFSKYLKSATEADFQRIMNFLYANSQKEAPPETPGNIRLGRSVTQSTLRSRRSISLPTNERQALGKLPSQDPSREDVESHVTPKKRFHYTFLFRTPTSPTIPKPITPTISESPLSPSSHSSTIMTASDVSESVKPHSNSFLSPGESIWDERRALLKTPFQILHDFKFRPPNTTRDIGQGTPLSVYCKVLDEVDESPDINFDIRRQKMGHLFTYLTPRRKTKLHGQASSPRSESLHASLLNSSIVQPRTAIRSPETDATDNELWTRNELWSSSATAFD